MGTVRRVLRLGAGSEGSVPVRVEGNRARCSCDRAWASISALLGDPRPNTHGEGSIPGSPGPCWFLAQTVLLVSFISCLYPWVYFMNGKVGQGWHGLGLLNSFLVLCCGTMVFSLTFLACGGCSPIHPPADQRPGWWLGGPLCHGPCY